MAIVPRYLSTTNKETLDSVIIVGFVGLFIIAIIGMVYFLPTVLTKLRASSHGLILTYAQARIVTKHFCNRRDFFVAVNDIWLFVEVPIDKLTNHYNAKGELNNLRDGIVEMKQRKGDVDFEVLSTFDLAGRDLKQEIKKAETRNWVFDLTCD